MQPLKKGMRSRGTHPPLLRLHEILALPVASHLPQWTKHAA
jgi:hypothetical protein